MGGGECMKLSFIGADHEVTGSCHYIEAAGHRMLVDYGMEQGRNYFENVPLPVNAGEIDYVFITHAHIDHTGLLPLLGAQGFHGKVFATEATCDLCEIMLLDSAHIQEFEAEWRNRKAQRKGEKPYVPLYTGQDAEKIIGRFVECPYNKEIAVDDGIRIRFTDVGHLLGSSAIEIWLTEDGVTKKLVFSGDLGNKNQPLLDEPHKVAEADYLIIESTYGDRIHEKGGSYKDALAEVLRKTFARGGNVVIPSFAVGRTQEILYFLRQIRAEHLVPEFEGFPVYVDSPLAVRSTDIFTKHTSDCFDEEARELVSKGINPISFPGLRLALTTEESIEINTITEPKVIISASGMCEAGRIKHHLKHNLWRPESTILFVGYQAEGTLGRALLNGAKKVTLFGEDIAVAAEIQSLPGISGHADQNGLLDWAAGFLEKPQKVFVVHGEDQVTEIFRDLLKDRLGYDAYAPWSGTEWDLITNTCLKETEGIPFVKKDAEGRPIPDRAAGRAATAYTRLDNALKNLESVVRMAKGFANKDLAKFADQIIALAEKWKK